MKLFPILGITIKLWKRVKVNMHMNSIFVVKLTWEDSGMNISFLEKKTYSKELQGSTYPIARQSGARKKSIKEVDLDKFSSDSYVNSYWKKNSKFWNSGKRKFWEMVSSWIRKNFWPHTTFSLMYISNYFNFLCVCDSASPAILFASVQIQWLSLFCILCTIIKN